VSRRLASLTLDNLDDLPRPCRRCVFWELDPIGGQTAQESGDPEIEKEAWLSATLLDWGSCGKIAYVDSIPAGYVLYAPPVHVPRSLAFPTSPVAGDAVLLMTALVLPEFAGVGLGRMLLQGVAKDLTRRGVRRSRRSATRRHPAAATSARSRGCPPDRWAAASCRPTSCCPWASRRCGRTTASRGCAST
jgi:GNAT superfamily N-acetyltransferase